MSVKEKDVEGLLKDFELRPEEFMFFLGAGFSKEIGLPGGQELAEFLAKKYGEEKAQGELDDVIASLLGKGVKRKDICEAIEEVFNKRELPGNEYNFLGIFFRIIDQVVQRLERENSLRQVIIATTNWDKTLTNFFGERVLSIYSGNQVSKSRDMAGRRILVYHLHGSIEDCDSMILTKEEKSRVSGDTPLWHSFTADVDKHRVIFIGYSMADEDILDIYIKSRKGATIKEKDYIIVNDEGSRKRIEGMLAENGLDRIANVVIMDSFEFLKELAKSIGLVVEEVKVELDTEKKMMEKLKEKGSVIVVGPRLSGLTTLYQKYSKEFPNRKLPLEYEYNEERKKLFIDLMNDLEKEKIALVAPEYLYENYFEEYKSRIKDEARLKNIDKLAKEITIKHRVSRDEARKYLEELVKRVDEDRKDKFDDELKGKILDLVNHDENYPLKLLRDVFQDVNDRMRHENKEDIKRALDEKINMRRDAEKNLGVSVLLWSTVPGVASVFGEALAQLSPVLLAVGILTGELVRSIKDIIEEKAKKNPFDKIIVLKKYWDSLNESEKKMLCYKLDSRQHLRPGKSEEYLRSVLGDELRSLEEKVEKAETYVRNLEEFQKKLEKLEKENRYRLEELAKSDEDIKKFKNEFKLALDELRKFIEDLRDEVKQLKDYIPDKVFTADRSEFEEASFYKNVKVEDGKLRISVRSEEEYRDVVIVGGFKELVNDVANTLRNLGVVVVIGPKGIGKSVLGATVVWELLRNGHTNHVVGVKELDRVSVSSTFDALLSKIKKLGPLLVVFDPSTTYAYSEKSGERDVPKKIENTLNNLFVSVKPGKQKMLLIILPTEMYKPVDQLVRKELGGSVKDLDKVIKEIKLNDKEFLAGVIREYSGVCQIGDEKLSGLAGKVADFDSGYTLVARLVGEELARNCNVDKINELIDKSRGKAEEFILGYINSFFEVNNDNRVRALVEIFALRRPFVSWKAPGSPILTPGIIEIIRRANDPKQMIPEMINLLVYRQHDLIEDTIKRLLDGEDLGEASRPWEFISVPKITSEDEALEHFTNKYGEEFFEKLSQFSNCWKRAALIIGYALTWQLVLPDKEKYSDSEVVDVLNPCKIDEYLLVDNKIPDFAAAITMAITRYLMIRQKNLPLLLVVPYKFASIFANEYENAIDEIKKLLEIWRKRGIYYDFETKYALGLASIVADTARRGEAINEDDADVALKATLPVARSIYVRLILDALMHLRDKAPQRYLEILAEASQIELDKNTVRFIYDELNYILSNFFSKDTNKNRLMKLGWPLVTAVEAYSFILRTHIMYFTDEEVENIIKSMCNLLNALKKESSELATIAEAHVLIPALMFLATGNPNPISKYCSVNDPVTRADEVRKSLRELANKSDELLKNKYFMNWVSQQYIKEMIINTETVLTNSLAEYKLYNSELDEASKLFNETAEVFKSIDSWYNYVTARDWFLLAEVLKARSINEYVNLASNFEKQWNEILEGFERSPVFINRPDYLNVTSTFLRKYLVYLASIGRYSDIEKTLSKYGVLLNYIDKKVLVSTRLMLRLLGFTKVDEVKPEELINVYEDSIYSYFLPALKLALGIEASVKECETPEDHDTCRYALLAVKGNSDALTKLRNSLNAELLKLVQGLDGKALVQLLAPIYSECRVALMLYTLVNGNAELAKKHAWWGSEEYGLYGRLFGDVYGACCDVNSEGFKLALLKLYYLCA
jgi:hypothetical protein